MIRVVVTQLNDLPAWMDGHRRAPVERGLKHRLGGTSDWLVGCDSADSFYNFCEVDNNMLCLPTFVLPTTLRPSLTRLQHSSPCSARFSLSSHSKRNLVSPRIVARTPHNRRPQCVVSPSERPSEEARDQSVAVPEPESVSLRDRITTCMQPTSSSRRTLSRLLFTVLLSTVLRHVAPVLATSALATAAVATTPFAASMQAFAETSFFSGLTASFLLVLASEIGDKTFFISALLSMKYSRALVLIGTMIALASMTVISVSIGQIFHALPSSLNTSIPFDDYAAVALLLWFGYQNIRDAIGMTQDDDDELQDAKDVVAGKSAEQKSTSSMRVVTETSSLIFLAEWGDKSMLATVALAAAKSPFGVIVGGISGHFVASIIAVVGGSVLGKYISERSARLIGGVLFFVFAILTIFGIY